MSDGETLPAIADYVYLACVWQN